MSDPNANRPGYKETKVGWIPGDWELCRMREVVTGNSGIKTGPFGSQLHKADYVESGVPVIMPINMRRGLIDPRGIAQITQEKASSLNEQRCKPGDIVFARRGEIGRCAIVRKEQDKWLNGTGSLRIRIATDKVSSEFTLFAVCMPRQLYWLNTNAVGQTMLNLSAEIIQDLPLPIPPLPEQRKIAEILRTWDEVIEKLEALNDRLERQSAAIYNRIFESDYTANDRLLRAREVFEVVSERKRTDLPLLAVMQDIGIVRREELDRRVVMPEGDISSYKVVRPGDFVISLRSFEGGLEYSNVTGLVSPAYTVLRPSREIESAYYRHFFKSRSFISRLDTIIFGIRDGKQIAFRDFGHMLIPNPLISDQRKRATLLDTAAELVVANKRRKKALERQKRGLMQKLLTGEWRVRVRLNHAGHEPGEKSNLFKKEQAI